MPRLAKLDPRRPLTFASCAEGRDLCQDLVDVVSWNTYYNWYRDGDVHTELEQTLGWVAAHGVLIVAPVYWYQMPSPLKLMVDRLVCADGGNPDPTRTQVYAAAYRRFLQHLDALTPLQRG